MEHQTLCDCCGIPIQSQAEADDGEAMFCDNCYADFIKRLNQKEFADAKNNAIIFERRT